MAYCAKCGREIPYDAVYCPNCGAQTRATSRPPPTTEFDRLTQDRALQEHWFGRVVAFIIDSVIFGIAFAIIVILVIISAGFPTALFGTSTGFAVVPFPFNPVSLIPLSWLWGVLFLLYFALAEAWYGRTIGKSVMNLHVVTTDGSPADFGKTFIRNFSKINWLLLLFD
ncbi:MAG: RDD family protein, partial [Nitrososphaerales archaeon]